MFRLLPDDCYDAFFSVIREITGQFSLFPPEEHSLSEDDQTKLLSASAEEFFQSDDGDSDPEISLGLLDLFRRREGSEEKGELFYYETVSYTHLLMREISALASFERLLVSIL